MNLKSNVKHIFGIWNNVKSKISKAEHILLLLDYDGTLTPIVRRPELARLPNRTRTLLKQLLRRKYVTVGIISGRSLRDVKKLVGLKGTIYVGNHGLELEGPNFKFVNPAAKNSKPLIQKIGRKLKEKLRQINGALVEPKGLTLSVHHRLVKGSDLIILKGIFDNVTKPFRIRKKIKVGMGKKVFEVRPPVKWDKGKIVKWILARLYPGHKAKGLLPIYLGDDRTDEDAFRALKRKGLTIFVGKKKAFSKADYFVTSTEEVNSFLDRILKLKD